VNLVVTGSRDWPENEPELIQLVIDRVFWSESGEPYHVYVGYDPERRRPSGVDRIVYEHLKWVNKHPHVPVTLHTFPADWNQWGKAAGTIRNADMLNTAQALGGGLVVAFHAWPTKYMDAGVYAKTGTNHCARLAERMGFTVYDIVRNPRLA